ncbi:polymorphic outer membrane protein middle domain-containing protein [Chlamydia vaughanii]|uniref:polymorphic outer membrane protein middle domain-containing protein n=1 Tax=Chlamydia vaughanii TaxID=3112552 RepID=UPI0032B214A9
MESIQHLLFENNFSIENGGAIAYVQDSTQHPAGDPQAIPRPVFFQNNALVEFLGNSSAKNGGAIYATTVEISGHGKVLFANNTAAGEGGAICIAPNGTIKINAYTGDIAFEGNRNKNGRNGIHLESGAKFVELTAWTDRTITFNDPITGDQANSNEKLIINRSKIANNPLPGTIIFGGSPEDPSNVSQFKQPLGLAGGTLIIKNGALIEAQSFVQEGTNSLVVLETGSSSNSSETGLRTSGNLELKNLHVSLNDISNKGGVSLSTTGNNGNLIISGPITFSMATEDFYKNPALENPITSDILQLSTAAGTLTLSDQKLSFPKTEEAHYGYQGSFSFSWGDTSRAAISSRAATFSWQPTGYLAFPNEKPNTTSLVPNNLWAMATDAQAIQRLIANSASAANPKNFWMCGIVHSLHVDKTKDEEKLHHSTGGYAIGISSQSANDFNFSLGFCQLFGKSKDCEKANIHEKVFAGSLYARYEIDLPLWRFFNEIDDAYSDFPIILQGQFGYFYSDNSLKTNYSQKNKQLAFKHSKGTWDNHGYCGDIDLLFLLPTHSHFIMLHDTLPFIKIQSVYVHQNGFHEQGYNRRNFDPTYLKNLSLSPGVTIYGYSPFTDFNYEVSVAYIADIYRRNPQNTTITVAPLATPFITKATNLKRHAGQLQLSGNLPINAHMTIFAQGNLEVRKSSLGYQANLGSSMHF